MKTALEFVYLFPTQILSDRTAEKRISGVG